MSDVTGLNAAEQVGMANMLLLLKGPVEMSCEYRNWKGEVSTRRLRPIEFWYGSTEWHPEQGLLLKAMDLDKGEERDFRMADFRTETLRAA